VRAGATDVGFPSADVELGLDLRDLLLAVDLEQVDAADGELAGTDAKAGPLPGNVGAVVEDGLGLDSGDRGLSTLTVDERGLIGEDGGGGLLEAIKSAFCV
jgi:hypothetical protein